jgi:hypothetical protein
LAHASSKGWPTPFMSSVSSGCNKAHWRTVWLRKKYGIYMVLARQERRLKALIILFESTECIQHYTLRRRSSPASLKYFISNDEGLSISFKYMNIPKSSNGMYLHRYARESVGRIESLALLLASFYTSQHRVYGPK